MACVLSQRVSQACGGSSALDLKTSGLCAIKKIEKAFASRSVAKRTFRELRFLRLFRHENVS